MELRLSKNKSNIINITIMVDRAKSISTVQGLQSAYLKLRQVVVQYWIQIHGQSGMHFEGSEV